MLTAPLNTRLLHSASLQVLQATSPSRLRIVFENCNQSCWRQTVADAHPRTVKISSFTDQRNKQTNKQIRINDCCCRFSTINRQTNNKHSMKFYFVLKIKVFSNWFILLSTKCDRHLFHFFYH